MNGLAFDADEPKTPKDNKTNCPMHHSVMFRCRVGILALALLIGMATFLVNLRIQGPMIQPDEGAYLANAAAIAGFPNDMANSYHAGYSMLIAPAFWLADTPQSIWLFVKVINALLIFFSVLGLWWLSGLLQPQLDYWRRFGAVAVTSLYPMWVVMAGYSFAQIAFVPVFILLFCVYLSSFRGSVGMWIVLGLLGGWLYWIHPVGVAVILALLFSAGYVAFCRRWWKLFALMTGTLVSMVLLYKCALTPWLIDRMTISGLQPNLHYPSITQMLSPLLTLNGLMNVLARTGGSFFYLTVGTVGLIWVGLIELTRRAIQSVDNEKKSVLLAERAASMFLWLALLGCVGLGVLLFSSTPEAQRLDHWMYGRYVEGVIAPVLLSGALMSSYKMALWAVPIAVASLGFLWITFNGYYTHVAYFNIPAFWQAFVFPGQSLWVWLAAGCIPIVALAKAPRRVGMFLLIVIFIYSSYLQIAWHDREAKAVMKRWEAALSVREMYLPGTLVGFEHLETESYHKDVFLFDFGFVLFDYRLKRITIENWLESFDGPLFAFDRHLDEKGIEAYPIAISPHGGPTLWAKGRSPAGELVYPINVADRSISLLRALRSGWYDLESTQVWSGTEAELRLPIPMENRGGGYAAEIAFFVNGASAERAVEIMFETEVNGAPVAGQLVFRSGALQRVLVPLSAGSADQFLRIRIPNATSPKDLQESLDVRVLGVALRSIELVRGGPDARIGTVIRASGFTEETPTHVGVLHEAALVTTGRAGYLVFGPYAAMGAGEYRLVLKGTASHVESAWVDVVSGSGSVQHARLRLSTPPGGEEGILASGRVSLVESVDDLEVRVSVGETDLVRLEGYELLPVEGESSASEME